jgi:hypothetical protein
MYFAIQQSACWLKAHKCEKMALLYFIYPNFSFPNTKILHADCLIFKTDHFFIDEGIDKVNF